MSGSGANLPIRITVEGQQQAEAAFNSVAQVGQRAMQTVGVGATPLGQQLGDVARAAQAAQTPVQGMVAGAQALASAYGPAGAAIATMIGIMPTLIERYMQAKDATEAFGEAERRTREAVAASAAIYNTAAEAAAALARARYAAALAGVEERIGRERESLRAQNAEASVLGTGVAPTGPGRRGGLSGAVQRQMFREGENARGPERQGAQTEIEIIGERLAQLEVERQRLLAMAQNPSGEQFGPPAPNGRQGGGGGGRGAAAREAMDVQAALNRMIEETTEQYNAFNRTLNLNAAGLESAAGALNTYQSQMTMLETALARGVISEQQFTQDVERATLALGRQIESTGQRTERMADMGQQLGATFNSAFEEAAGRGEKLSRVLQGLEQDLARLILRQFALQPAANALSGAINYGMKSSGISEYFSGLFSGARAAGGPVFPGNDYLVGENGPEVVRFGTAGHVSPGMGATFAPTYYIDARGADPSMMPRFRAEMQAISMQTVAAWAESINRGGPNARISGRR